MDIDEDWDDNDDGAWDDDDNHTVGDTDIWNSADNNNQPELIRSRSYCILNQTDLEQQQQHVIQTTAELLFIDTDEAISLLKQFQWNKQSLEVEWFKNQAGVRSKYGVSTKSSSNQMNEIKCNSALCEENLDDGMALSCGHYFCGDCWRGFLESEIVGGFKCVSSTCPGMKCTEDHIHSYGCACREVIPTKVYRKYIKGKESLAKYNRWILDSFVDGCTSIKWCPNPSCDRAIESSSGSRDVECFCGHRFCFSCSSEAHTPAPCDLVRKWGEKDATEVWLQARTKQCPKCGVRIEKNRACNHMKCIKCSHDFCWLCKGPWSEHGGKTGGYYVCNQYKERSSRGVHDEEEKRIFENTKILRKYTYYYQRFKESEKGIEFTRRRWDEIEKELEGEDYSSYAFLSDATQQLISARRVLQWTYCMAYYLRGGKEKHLFEHQQGLLTHATEGLQDIFDNKKSIDLIEERKRIIDMISSLSKFSNEMVSHVEKGDLENVLLSDADTSVNTTKWSCTSCTKENTYTSTKCTTCQACRQHGERDCRGCN